MKDREPISETQQKVDILLTTISGGVIGIIGAIAESKTLSQTNIDTDAAIIFGGATIVGASLVVNGAVKFMAWILSSKNGGE